jgi:hypothetical protein
MKKPGVNATHEEWQANWKKKLAVDLIQLAIYGPIALACFGYGVHVILRVIEKLAR